MYKKNFACNLIIFTGPFNFDILSDPWAWIFKSSFDIISWNFTIRFSIAFISRPLSGVSFASFGDGRLVTPAGLRVSPAPNSFFNLNEKIIYHLTTSCAIKNCNIEIYTILRGCWEVFRMKIFKTNLLTNPCIFTWIYPPKGQVMSFSVGPCQASSQASTLNGVSESGPKFLFNQSLFRGLLLALPFLKLILR